MIDNLYRTVQDILNKNQLGSIKPDKFNALANNATIIIYNELLYELKSAIRKSNWHLDGKELGNVSEHYKQLVEHFIDEVDVTKTNDHFELPINIQYIKDINYGAINVDKKSYEKFKALQRNIYANPKECNPIYTKLSNKLKVLPESIDTITIGFLRKPKVCKWTFTLFENKPMFNSTASDFQDVDIPYVMFNKMVNLIVDQASISIRDFNVNQANNQNQREDIQKQNIE